MAGHQDDPFYGVTWEWEYGRSDVKDVTGDYPAVEYAGPASGSLSSIAIPDIVTVDGIAYKVISIAPKAFKNNKKLKKITIGRNIIKIGKQAFYGCINLKKIKINTSLLTKKSVGAKAFYKTSAKAKVKVPKSKLKAYKKFLNKKGISKKAVIK